MDGCIYKESCEFYSELFQKLGMVFFFTVHYCHSPGYTKCARYLYQSSRGVVPPDLYPTQTWRIKNLLAKMDGKNQSTGAAAAL